MFPSKNMNSIYEGISYIKYAPYIADNLMYTIEFLDIAPLPYQLIIHNHSIQNLNVHH